MDLEYEYSQAKKITDDFEAELLKTHKIVNLKSLFFELRKRTYNVKVRLNTVEPHIHGYFDELILGHIENRSCNWYMFIYDYSKNIHQNEKFENNFKVTMMYESNFCFTKWFSNLEDALNHVQEYYISEKEDFNFSSIFQPYYLKLNDIISDKKDYLL